MLEMEILCNFLKVDVHLWNFQGWWSRSSGVPKKNLGSQSSVETARRIFLAFALCNFQSQLQWISLFSCGEYISVSMRFIGTSVIWKLGRIQPRIQIWCLLCWQPPLVSLTQPLNAISAPISYISPYITSNEWMND